MFKFFVKQAAQRAKQFGESPADFRRPTLTRLAYYARHPGFWFEAAASIVFITVFTVATADGDIPTSEWVITIVFFGLIFMLYQYLCVRATSTRPKRKNHAKQ